MAVTLEPRSDPDFKEYAESTVDDEVYSSCHSVSITSSMYYGTRSANMYTVTLFDSLGCTTIVLNRVMPKTTDWLLREKRSAQENRL